MTKYGLGLGTILAPWLCSGTGGRPRCVARCVGPYQGCPRLWLCPPLARPIAAHFALHWERAFGSSLWGKRMEATAAQPKSAARAKAVLAPWGCPLRPLTTQWSQLRPCVAAAVAGTEVRALGAGQDVALVCAGVGGGVGLAPGLGGVRCATVPPRAAAGHVVAWAREERREAEWSASSFERHRFGNNGWPELARCWHSVLQEPCGAVPCGARSRQHEAAAASRGSSGGRQPPALGSSPRPFAPATAARGDLPSLLPLSLGPRTGPSPLAALLRVGERPRWGREEEEAESSQRAPGEESCAAFQRGIHFPSLAGQQSSAERRVFPSALPPPPERARERACPHARCSGAGTARGSVPPKPRDRPVGPVPRARGSARRGSCRLEI